jgi:hypothetical protein
VPLRVMLLATACSSDNASGPARALADRPGPDRLGQAALPQRRPRAQRAQSGCATDCCTSSAASPCTPAKRPCSWTATGRGPANSRPPSHASPRCHRRHVGGCHGFPSQEDGYLGHPPCLDVRIAAIAGRQRGVITSAQLVQAGLGSSAISKRAANGRSGAGIRACTRSGSRGSPARASGGRRSRRADRVLPRLSHCRSSYQALAPPSHGHQSRSALVAALTADIRARIDTSTTTPDVRLDQDRRPDPRLDRSLCERINQSRH